MARLVETVIVRHSQWERARRSGIVRIDAVRGQRGERGEVLGVIGDALGTRHSAVRASRTGIVLGYSRNPLASQGDALVHILVLEGGASSPYELHTGDSSRATVTHKGARIALVELQPYPFSSRTIAPGDYRATLTVSR